MISVQLHTPTIEEKKVPDTTSINHAATAPHSNRKDKLRQRTERHRRRVTMDNGHQAPERKVSESDRCDSDDIDTPSAGDKWTKPVPTTRAKRPEEGWEHRQQRRTASDGADQSSKTALRQARNTIEEPQKWRSRYERIRCRADCRTYGDKRKNASHRTRVRMYVYTRHDRVTGALTGSLHSKIVKPSRQKDDNRDRTDKRMTFEALSVGVLHKIERPVFEAQTLLSRRTFGHMHPKYEERAACHRGFEN